jgi:geranylgeranyl pyrophosphate synthase
MNASSHILHLQKQIEERLESLFRHRQPKSLYEPMFHPLRSGGKRIRPLLCLLSSEAVGGSAADCFDAALALELLHTFTLVHDDIMDHDKLRRGQPTVHIQWDEPTAILAGDGLVTLAYQSLLETRHPDLVQVMRRFTEGLLILCEGQALDKAFEKEKEVSLEHYLDMIHKKTAKLLEVSCEMGGLLGNGSSEEVKALQLFARELGIAFQIQDDLLDLVSDETVFGKPRGSDLIEKKKTYLTIHFEQHASGSQLEQYHRLSQTHISSKDVPVFLKLFTESGTIGDTKMQINRGIEKAISYLSILKPGKSRQILEAFAVKIRDRNT